MHLYYTYMHTGCSLLFIAHIDTRRYQLLTTTIYRSIILLLFLQKQNLATAIYLFGLGTLCAYSFVRGRVHAYVLHTYIRICTPYIPYIPYIHTQLTGCSMHTYYIRIYVYTYHTYHTYIRIAYIHNSQDVADPSLLL